MSGLIGHTYEERLVELRLPSLRDRRREIHMAQTYRIVNGPDSDQWFERADNRRPTRAAAGRDNIVKKKRSHHEFRNNFFSSRVADEWNALPDDIKSARTVNGFKCLYKRHRESTVALATEG